MNKFKASMAIAALAVAATAFAGEEITFTNLYAIGGGTDKVVSGLVPSLERQGFTVKKQFVKACVDGLNMIAAQPKNHFLMTVTGDQSFSDPTRGGTRCPAQATAPVKLQIFSSLNGAPTHLCTAPGYEGTTFERLRALSSVGKKIRIGYSSEIHATLVKKMLDTQMPNLKYVMLQYSGGSTIHTAIKAGDIDMYTGSSLAIELIPLGSKCLALSDRSGVTVLNPTPLPFYGEIVKGQPVPNFAEFVTQNLMTADTAQVSPAAKTALKIAMTSPEFKAAYTATGTKHLGLGDGVTAEQTTKVVESAEQNYVFKK